MSLKGQSALIVGGASGIGLAAVRLFLQQGANVTLSDVSNTGARIVKELQEEFGAQRCLFAKADVRDAVQLEAAFTVTKNAFKRLDIVVNAAGILNDLDWSLEVDVNLKGVIRATLLAWKHMGKHEGGNGGTVINVSSICGLMAMQVVPLYSSTKHAVIGFGRSVGEEYHLNRTGVRVITICPGHTDTAMLTNITLLTTELTEELNIAMKTHHLQGTDNVASGILHLIQHGRSGSVWVSEDEKPAYELVFPAYQELRLKN